MLSATVYAGRAGLVVQFSNSSVFKKCVDFQGGDSAFEFIKNSGLVVATYKYETLGIALCGIGSVGCDAGNCFCKPDYWGFYYLDGNNWNYSDAGIGDYSMKDGDVIGFRWGSYGNTPEMHSFNELCGNVAERTPVLITAPDSVPVNSTILVKMTSEDGKPLVYESVVVEFSGGRKELVTNESGEATFSADREGIYSYSSPNHLPSQLGITSIVMPEAPAEEAPTSVGMALANPLQTALPILAGGIAILAFLYILMTVRK